MRILTSKKAAAAFLAAGLLAAGPARAAREESRPATRSVLINPATAMSYSALLPGAGQVYAGEPLRGALLIGLDLGLAGAGTAGYFLRNDTLMQGAIVGMIITTVFATFDAYLMVRDRNLSEIEIARQVKGKPLPQ